VQFRHVAGPVPATAVGAATLRVRPIASFCADFAGSAAIRPRPSGRQGFRKAIAEPAPASARPSVKRRESFVATVLVNGAAFVPVTPVPSWGPLLAAVDSHVAPSGEIVAAVRFDGVDEPGFRDAAVLDLVLGQELIVEIDTLPPSALLASVLDEASRSLPAVCASTLELATQLRGADVAPAARTLAQLAESIASLVQLVVAAAAARQVPIDALMTAEGPALPILRALDAPLEPLLEAQRAGDWITVADILEYDLGPILPRLLAVIDSLR
jgi:hypothetical protein